MVKNKRLAFYLMPPYPLSLEILDMRNMVNDQYKINAALNFMVHMTIKGFFKMVPDMNYRQLIQGLNNVILKYKSFKIYPTKLKVFSDVILGVEFAREKNETLWQIHNDCYTVIRPFISSDCTFTPSEPKGDNFIPHITISMTDVSKEMLEDMKDFLSDIRFDNRGYMVKQFKLYEFESSGWQTDEWIYTLQWKILHAFSLKK